MTRFLSKDPSLWNMILGVVHLMPQSVDWSSQIVAEPRANEDILANLSKCLTKSQLARKFATSHPNDM